MSEILYQLDTMADATPEAMVHFKAFVEFMEKGNIQEPMVVRVQFIKASQQAAVAQAEIPDTAFIKPLFWSVDDSHFSVLHGVNTINGQAWDSEGFAEEDRAIRAKFGTK
jgi:hypothetical protein